MDLGLTGLKVVVTGGTRGIGREITLSFARSGADVVACYRSDEAAAKQLVADLEHEPGRHRVVRADVTSVSDVQQLMAECRRDPGHIDVLVNNAGAISQTPFEEMDDDSWHRVLDTNLTGAFIVTQKALPLLSKGASIINIGSGAAMRGLPLRAHYTAAKAGLLGLSRSLCKELGPRGYRVNTINSGPVDTGDPMPPRVREGYLAAIPLGRFGTPEDVAGAVLFLASRMSSFITGAVIDVDGGI